MISNLINKAKHKGSDEEYLEWIRKWPSALTGAYSEFVDGEGRCEAAHVRRASSSGVAIKPEYSAIPLTRQEHAMQHQKGESIFCPQEWYDQQAIKYLTDWINGKKPPVAEEQKKNWKKEYIISHPGQMIALWLLLKKHFTGAGSPDVKCTLQRHVKRRSKAQNRAQWGVIYDQILEFYEDDMNALVKDTFKAINFGVNVDFIHWLCKALHNEGKSTAGLSTIESKEYMERVMEYFLHEHNHQLNEPISIEETNNG